MIYSKISGDIDYPMIHNKDGSISYSKIGCYVKTAQELKILGSEME